MNEPMWTVFIIIMARIYQGYTQREVNEPLSLRIDMSILVSLVVPGWHSRDYYSYKVCDWLRYRPRPITTEGIRPIIQNERYFRLYPLHAITHPINLVGDEILSHV